MRTPQASDASMTGTSDLLGSNGVLIHHFKLTVVLNSRLSAIITLRFYQQRGIINTPVPPTLRAAGTARKRFADSPTWTQSVVWCLLAFHQRPSLFSSLPNWNCRPTSQLPEQQPCRPGMRERWQLPEFADHRAEAQRRRR